MTLRPNISSRYQTSILWVLVACFLLQPLLAYLVTPMVSKDAKGVHVVICTLEGTKEVFVELPSIDGQDNVELEDCPALKLYQVAGATQISLPQPVPVVSFFVVAVIDPTADHEHHSLHFSAYSSRAPPLA